MSDVTDLEDALRAWSDQIGAKILREFSAYPLTEDEQELVKTAAFAGSALTIEEIQRLDTDLGAQVVLKILNEPPANSEGQ